MITFQQFNKIFPDATEVTFDALCDAMEAYGITSALEASCFLAQVGHESAGFTARKENLNYSAQGLVRVFGKYFDATKAQAYARQPQKIANLVYANRMGNGDEKSGDGWRFSGKGFIQLTGKQNVSAYAKHKGMTIDQAITYLDTVEGAADSAGWFWWKNNLEKYCNDFTLLTKKINGGTIGLEDREKHFKKLYEVLCQSIDDGSTP
jgi:putative chitinase